jgi:HD-like signal output (HDOD) protein
MYMNCPFCTAEISQLPQPMAVGHIGACPACLNPYVIQKEGHQYTTVPLPMSEDVRMQFPPESMGRALLDVFREKSDDLPVLPEVANHVLRKLSDPEYSVAGMAEMIAEDAVIAGKVLAVANSAMYGGLSRIADLRSACSRLGMRTVANIVEAAVNAKLYTTTDAALRSRMEHYWVHSLATAHFASEIAVSLSEPRGEMLFVAGLMHGVGRPAILDVITKSTNGSLATLQKSHELLDEIVERCYSLLGLHLVVRWNLPAEIAVTTGLHSRPDQVMNDKAARMAHMVCLACALADVSGYACSPGENKQSILNLPSTQALGLTDLRVAMLRTDVEERLQVIVNALRS